MTESLVEQFSQFVGAGNPVELVCDMLGVPKSTVYNWLTIGRKDQAAGHTDTLPSQFLDALTRAHARVEIATVAQVRLAGAKDWRAAAWWLERRHPERWSAKTQVEHTGSVDGKVEVQVSREQARERLLTDDDSLRTLDAVADRLTAAALQSSSVSAGPVRRVFSAESARESDREGAA